MEFRYGKCSPLLGECRNAILALLFSAVSSLLLDAKAQAAEGEPSIMPASLPPSPPSNADTQDTATVEPSPIPSTIYQPPVAIEPELPPNAPEPEVTINGHPVSESVRRFRYHFSVTVRTVYDDNININNGHPVGDLYTSFEPSVRLTLGEPGSESNNILQFIYAPSAVFYVNHSNADAVQHIIHLEGQRVFGKLSATLSQNVQLLDSTDLRSLTDTTGRQADIDIGARTRQNIYSTKLGASYDLSSKTFLSGGIDYSRTDNANLISSQSLSSDLFFNYNYSPKLVVGLGGTFGYDETDFGSPTQHFEQINVRASYSPGGKLSASASAGFEFRQFAGDSRGTYISPVFELSASYAPFDSTSITIAGSRRTQNSAVISGSDFAETEIHLAVTQRFLQRVFTSLSLGYTNSTYFSTMSDIDVNRSDNYYYVQIAIDTNITRYWDIGIYYLHREDSSSSDLFSFSDNQFGLRSTLTF